MFGTLKNTRQMNIHGIGLGLFICKKIVNEFNGQISVKSEFGNGSTFTFYFEIGQVGVGVTKKTTMFSKASDIIELIEEN